MKKFNNIPLAFFTTKCDQKNADDRKTGIKLFCNCLILFFLISGLSASGLYAQRYMEKLNRGTVAVRTGSNSVFISWRILGTEWQGVSYNIYRDNTKLNASPITGASNYVDNISTDGTYSIAAVINGVEQARSKPVSVWQQFYKLIPLIVPPGGTTPDGVSYTYSPNDCSVGDLDGDGDYEIVVKWDPSNSKDNSQSGYTGNVYLDAYKMDGTFLWRIDLGRNIRAGAHYTQFMVYDLDGDGKAEIACKTADGTIDGLGNVIGDPSADYRNSSGYILSGPEYFTIFRGSDGAALQTVNYIPARGDVSSWGDSYGNRVDRFLACIAYLDGVHPSVVMCRGYYTRTVLVAWDWRNGTLTHRWTFDSNTSGNSGYAGQGNHNLTAADVDGDGRDEIVYGSCTIDDDGTGLYTTGLGHGDALHVGDLDPDRPGLEVWQAHEGTQAGATFRDAKTGEVLWMYDNPGDVGRALAADIDPSVRGVECWAAGSPLYSCTGQVLGTAPSQCNFAVWWDGDLSRELLDGTKLDKWNSGTENRLVTLYNYATATANNGTKNTPNLSADILGDWREEIILHSSDNQNLILFTTTTPTTTRLYTLMHDKTYRLSVAAQNVAYNQPPHTSFYLGTGMATPPTPNIILVGGQTSNNPPSVSITSPVNGTSYTEGDQVTISADASDNDGNVSLVEFYQGTTKLGEDATAPYSFIWNSVPVGTYTLTAKATDNGGASTTSSSVTISVNPQNTGNSITIQENTTGFCSVDGTVDSDNSGFTGTGFANTTNAAGNGINWNVNIGSAGTYVLSFRYANGGGADRPASLLINGSQEASVSFPATTDWTTWSTVSAALSLSAGITSVRLEATGSGGLANIDYITISGNDPQVTDCGGGTTNTPPVAAVSVSPVSGTAPLTVSLDASGSTDPDGDVLTYTWDFGDGTSGTGVSLTHAYSNTGTFIATVTVSDGQSSDQASATITVTGGSTETPCDSPVSITIPFTYDGAGKYCWVTSQQIDYINSWNLDLLEINGTDYTNTWSNSLPAPINGNYYIHYVGSYSWSHFEAPAVKNAENKLSGPLTTNVKVYPNPSSNSFILEVINPKDLQSIRLFNLEGQRIKDFKLSDMKNGTLKFGRKLPTGVYFIQLLYMNSMKSVKILKQ